MKPISLKMVVEEMECMPDEEYMTMYLDMETGEIFPVRAEVMSAVEDDPESGPELTWESDEEYAAARAISEGSERYLSLPSKFDIHEWDIMRQFTESLDDDRIVEELNFAIHGRGAFRHFKNTIHHHGIEKQWYNFRTEAFAEIARDWLRENKILFIEDLFREPEAPPEST
ncbi:MAG: hypothetical protein HYZ00_05360 [Candidatus Hydrogenedentes bacterium]|nr:hypothetical protein [Candidatus Hydrogenedentota bacterium]